MERKKYKKPMFSEALIDMATLIGCAKNTETDAFSRKEASLGETSDDEADKSSLFSKFTHTKRPSGFFGTQPLEVNNNQGEIIIEDSPSKTGMYSDKHVRHRIRDPTIVKSE